MMPGRDRDQSAMGGGMSSTPTGGSNTARVVVDEDTGDEF
jgi:hypothetical protein